MINVLSLFGNIGDLESLISGTWSEPARSIALALSLEREVMDGMDGFSLSDPGKVRLVLSGSVEIFYVAPAADPLDARRTFLFTVPAGGLVASIAASSSHRLLAVPSNQAEIATIPASKLRLGMTGSAEHDPNVVALWQDWLERMVDSATRPSPADTKVVKAGEQVAVVPGDVLQSSGPPVWLPSETLDHPTGRRSLVTRLSCVTVARPGELAALSMADWLATPDWRDDLIELNAAVLSSIPTIVQRVEAERTGLDVGSARYADEIFSDSLQAMAQVLASDVPPVPGEANPFSTAAALVCDRIGVVRKPRPVPLPPDAQPEQLALLYARAHEIQVRSVELEGRWWTSDHGALLVVFGPGKHPAALLPRGPGSYRLVDPATGTDVKVTAKVARLIDPIAFAFAPDLPGQNLTPWQIFSFGFRGGYRDARNLVLTLVLSGFLALAVPIATSWIMDPIIPEAQTDQLTVLITALVIIGIALTAFSFVQSLSMLRLESHMDNRVQGAVWVRLLNLPASFFRGFSVGDLANRAGGINGIRSALTGTVNRSLVSGISGLFSLLLIIWYNWRLALVGIVIAVIYCSIIFLIGRRILARNRETMALTGRLQGLVLQILSSVSKLRVAGAERRAFSRWSSLYLESVLVGLHQHRLNNHLIVFKSVVQYLAVLAALAAIGFESGQLLAFFHTPTEWSDIMGQGLRTAMPTASFIAFNVAYGQFLGSVFGLTQTAVEVLNVKPLWERITPVIQAEEEIYEGAADPGDIGGAIEIANVQFRYAPDAPLVLQGLTLHAPRGQFVAIVGPSGAGKSSLIRLLLGFETPEAGSILIDDMDLQWLDKRAVRRQFGVVLQNGRLLAGSIYNNIAAGASISRDEAMQAARVAGLDKDIEAMPMGLETVLSEGAATLSGGQRQRLMIARAIVRRPRVLIFDEATSALDNETQAQVSRNLETLACTRIVIAHRLSTIIHADLIYVIDQGRVVEQGTYQELMAKNGTFSALAKRQIA